MTLKKRVTCWGTGSLCGRVRVGGEFIGGTQLICPIADVCRVKVTNGGIVVRTILALLEIYHHHLSPYLSIHNPSSSFGPLSELISSIASSSSNRTLLKGSKYISKKNLFIDVWSVSFGISFCMFFKIEMLCRS